MSWLYCFSFILSNERIYVFSTEHVKELTLFCVTFKSVTFKYLNEMFPNSSDRLVFCCWVVSILLFLYWLLHFAISIILRYKQQRFWTVLAASIVELSRVLVWIIVEFCNGVCWIHHSIDLDPFKQIIMSKAYLKYIPYGSDVQYFNTGRNLCQCHRNQCHSMGLRSLTFY